MAPQITATRHKGNLSKDLCVMEENPLLLHTLEKKNETHAWYSLDLKSAETLMQLWPLVS